MSNQRIERFSEFFDRDIQDFNITSTQAIVWCCIYRHTDWDSGMAKLSYSRVAYQCNCSDLTAKRALRSLEDAQLIKRLRQGTGREPSTYTLLDQSELMPQTVAKLQQRKNLIDSVNSNKHRSSH